MASNASSAPQEEEEEEEEDDDEGQEILEYEDDDEADEDYDPNADASGPPDPDYLFFLQAVFADSTDAEDSEDSSPDVEILEIRGPPPATAGGNREEEEAAEDSEDSSPDVEVLEIRGRPPATAGGNRGDEEEADDGEKHRTEEASGASEWDPSSASPNCPICFEPWAPDGPHRVCCIPCGHIYGRSCLEKWLYRKDSGKCPQCKRKCKHKDIINLYALPVVLPNDDLEKELRTLREEKDLLQLKNTQLHEEIKKHKLQMHSRDVESSRRQKILCLEPVSSGETQRRLSAGSHVRRRNPIASVSGSRLGLQNFSGDGSRNCSFVMLSEFMVDGAKVMGIDASSQILIISGKPPGVSGENVVNKVSLLVPNEIDRIQLPLNTGLVKDMCFLSSGLVLLAGRKLSLFSMGSNNCVLKYDLLGSAWSCSGDLNNPYHIYAGMQNGMLMVFDLRQTARHLDSIEGLSRNPVHTTQSILHGDGTRKVLTASALGPCVWDVGGSGERPSLIPEMDNEGVCISLAYCSSSDNIVASYRPKVEFSNDTMSSQSSLSPSPTISGSGRLGSHVLIKRVDGASYQRHAVTHCNVSEVRMAKSAIISSEDNSPFFGYGDELSHGICLWDLPSLQVYNRLKPHQHPILDVKYACTTTGSGFLGCISEDRCQVFNCF